MAEESSRRRLSGNGAARGYGQNCAARYSEPVAAAGMDEVPVLRALLEISQAVQRAQYFDEALEVIAEQALLALDAASLSISRWERPDNVLRTLVNVGDLGPGEERWPENELYPVTDDQHVVELLQHGRPYISSIDDENVDPAAVAVLRRVNKESELAVAVMFDDTMWGELWATGAGGRRFGLDDIQLLQAIAAHVAVAIGRTELFSMVWRYAFEDPLTGLANRRKIDEWTVLDEGGQSRPAVLVCDVDGLKEVNDRRGHPAGDAVLRGVATVLTGIASATTGSLVARLGGDEFCIVLPHSTLSDAERFARDAGRLLRRDTAESVSLSWGAAGFGRRPARVSN